MNIELTIKNAHLILEDFMGVKQVIVNSNICECGKMLSKDEYFYVCLNCGTIDFDKPVTYVNDLDWVAPAILYKRRIYCIDKLKLIAGYKQSNYKHYNSMIDILRKHDVNNIRELKKLLNECGYKRFNKFIYGIWLSLKGNKLINLSYAQIDLLADEFIKIESNFKSDNKLKRKNMLAYNSIIYILMKKNKMKGYKHIILPINHIIICKKLKTLL